MNLEDGRIKFIDRFASRGYWPTGAPGRRMIDGQLITIPAKRVKFQNNQYATNDPEIAKGMLADDVNFNQMWGFYVNEECLPEPVREAWGLMHRDNRKIVMDLLIDGASVDDALSAINPAKDAEEKAQRQADPAPYACPVPGCEMVVRPGKKDPRKSLQMHIRMKHPGWKGEVVADNEPSPNAPIVGVRSSANAMPDIGGTEG